MAERARKMIDRLQRARAQPSFVQTKVHSIEEENHQTSSWESEPEGANAEERANLETHIEES